MMKQVHIFLSNLREVIFTFNLHRLCLNPMTIFPIGTIGRYFTQINLRIEIRCKRITMITAITIQNINGINFIKIMLQRIGCEDACNPRVKTTAQKCCNTGFFKSVLISPLPGIIKICRKSFVFASFFINCTPLWIIRIFRFIIGCVNIIHLACQTSIHDCQILIRQCHIQNRIRLIIFNQCNQFIYIVCIHLGRCNLRLCRFLQLFFQIITF